MCRHLLLKQGSRSRLHQPGKPPEFGPRPVAAAGPQVCILYESDAERVELMGRLNRANLGHLPRIPMDLEREDIAGCRPGRASRSFPWRPEAIGGGVAAGLGFLGSHWILVAALTLVASALVAIARFVATAARSTAARTRSMAARAH